MALSPADRDTFGGYLSEHHAYGQTAKAAADYAEDLAAEMLATVLGVEFNPDSSWDEKRELWRIADVITKTKEVTQTCRRPQGRPLDHGDRRGGAPAVSQYLHRVSQHRIAPPAVTGREAAADLIDSAFLSYNGGRLREVCRVFATKMLADDCTVGLALSGALTPAGLGMSCLIPLIRAGFVDWIVSTGANLYHDTHFALDLPLHQSRPNLDDYALRENAIIRIYDIVFDYQTLLDTDAFYRELIASEAFARSMGTAEFHHEGPGALSRTAARWAARAGRRTACSPRRTRRACRSTRRAPATARSV